MSYSEGIFKLENFKVGLNLQYFQSDYLGKLD